MVLFLFSSFLNSSHSELEEISNYALSKDNKVFDIKYEIINGTVTNMRLPEWSETIHITFNPIDNGTLRVAVPEGLINSMSETEILVRSNGVHLNHEQFIDENHNKVITVSSDKEISEVWLTSVVGFKSQGTGALTLERFLFEPPIINNKPTLPMGLLILIISIVVVFLIYVIKKKK